MLVAVGYATPPRFSWMIKACLDTRIGIHKMFIKDNQKRSPAVWTGLDRRGEKPRFSNLSLVSDKSDPADQWLDYSKELLFNHPALLSMRSFLERMRIEKRRADRSKSALSILLISFGKDGSDDAIFPFENFRIKTRETDIVGFVSRGVVGVLLPETDAKGAAEISQRIRANNPGIAFDISAGTYPDQLFASLVAEGGIRQTLCPALLDDLDDTADRSWIGPLLKRNIDIVGSIVGLVLFSPVMLVIAATIKATSPGPVIFKQTRLGRKGIPFAFYKFRSMYYNTDDSLHRDFVADLINGKHDRLNQGDTEKPLYKIKSDPRVTWIGRIIRKTSMDELPQFFNVLKGDMSLVGPRPPLPYEVERYQSWHLRRVLAVRPGITGLWQVKGRSKTTFDEMVRLDVRYIEEQSLFLDIKILLKTVITVVNDVGAV